MRKPKRPGARYWLPLQIRLERRIEANTEAECWRWTGCHDRAGYGQITLNTDEGKRRVDRVSRVMWRECFGPIEKGLHVLHKCDNGWCVNPFHLFVGTHTENMADMARKGRASRFTGSKSSNAKLTAADIPIIRGSTKRNCDLAKEYGVSDTVIGLVKSRKRWTHVQ